MKCTTYSSEEIKYPEKQSSLELVTCLSCGHTFYVHCIYPIQGELQNKHKRHLIYYSVSSPKSTVASGVKLKSIQRLEPFLIVATIVTTERHEAIDYSKKAVGKGSLITPNLQFHQQA